MVTKRRVHLQIWKICLDILLPHQALTEFQSGERLFLKHFSSHFRVYQPVQWDPLEVVWECPFGPSWRKSLHFLYNIDNYKKNEIQNFNYTAQPISSKYILCHISYIFFKFTSLGQVTHWFCRSGWGLGFCISDTPRWGSCSGPVKTWVARVYTTNQSHPSIFFTANYDLFLKRCLRKL